MKKIVLSLLLVALMATPTLAANRYSSRNFNRVRKSIVQTQRFNNAFVIENGNFIDNNLDLLALYRYPIPIGFWLGERQSYGNY